VEEQREPTELPMLGSERRERSDAAKNRVAILAAAERLVAERGVGAVSMDEVACAACVGKGTLFRRFGNRASLLRALLDERERTFQEGFIRGPAPLGPGAPAPQRLVAFGHRLLEMSETHGELLAAAESGSSGQRLRHSVYGVYRLHVKALLREIAPERDPDYMADALLATLAAELVLHQRRNQGLTLQQLKDGWQELVSLIAG